MEALFCVVVAIAMVVVTIRILISLLAFFFRLLLGFVALLVLLAILLAMSASPSQGAPGRGPVESMRAGATDMQSRRPVRGLER